MMRRDDGFAIAAVSLLGSVLVLFSLVITSRTLNETQIGSEDRSWEQAVFVSESGVDQPRAGGRHERRVPIVSENEM